ncbi:MAG TPA: hypothetical protein VFU74_19245 [Actinocrinis sp.]|nr:hypothetical protein [Actinocrinis sp.]
MRRSTGFCGSEPALWEGFAVAGPGDALAADGEAGALLGAALGTPVLAVLAPDVWETVGAGDEPPPGPVPDPQDDSAHTVAAITTSEATPLARAPLIVPSVLLGA